MSICFVHYTCDATKSTRHKYRGNDFVTIFTVERPTLLLNLQRILIGGLEKVLI